MEISTAFSNNIKRVALVLTIITTVSFLSSANGASRFSKNSDFPSNFRAVEDEEFAEEPTRVKRQTRPCPPPPINCAAIPNVNKYRTIDGTCNNVNNPHCGASDIPFIRWKPRNPSGGAFRCPPSSCARPRDISFSMNNDCFRDQFDGITVMVMQWGQFIDHDLVFTPEATDNGCCQDFRTLTPTSSNCVPIDVRGDPFYSSLSTTVNCLPFVRSRVATCTDSTNRETINERTAYLDGSMVYGSTELIANHLRTFRGGKLSSGPGNENPKCVQPTQDSCLRSFLPVTTGSRGNDEFFAGDSRVEEQPSLTSIHTLFVRFHNLVAQNLNCTDNSDENKYQAARKIVGAIVQQITYHEFLPIVLGNNIMNDPFYGALDLDWSYSYNRNLCVRAPNVFATAAFRFGHSLIPNAFHLSNGNIIQLAESFNNHGVTINNKSFPSHFLGGIIDQQAMPMDQMLVEAISNFLFAQSPFEFGSDLYARNIQRGRDHGIPGYVAWHNSCVDQDPSRTIHSFNDLVGLMPDCVISAFQNLYATVHDIDLFPAGIAEFKVPGGLVGPTFACIIAEYFANLKFGDRFWFQGNGVFTPGQVSSISATRLSSLICLFTNVNVIQPNVMLPHTDNGGLNPLLSCSTILQNGVLSNIKGNPWLNYC